TLTTVTLPPLRRGGLGGYSVSPPPTPLRKGGRNGESLFPWCCRWGRPTRGRRSTRRRSARCGCVLVLGWRLGRKLLVHRRCPVDGKLHQVHVFFLLVLKRSQAAAETGEATHAHASGGPKATAAQRCAAWAIGI